MEQQVFGGVNHTGRPARPLWNAVLNGLRCRCPKCGEGKLFDGFLKVAPACDRCGEEFHHHRADDLPAYIVVVIVGHVIVGAFMSFEATSTLSTWQHLAIWVPLTIVMAIGMLRPVKGSVVGLQWALYMHGFGGERDALETHPEM
ncbi:MAG: DUF983 domain-containing protein [Mesorhizobium sp.]|nr:DUF983 domain-containing protein [Mesorhizobium sp.]MBL8576179.1 DUF983 domain-containing protein [Mesorhizobium sp.]